MTDGRVDQRGVGLVVVSHSRALAHAAVAFAAEMLHGRSARIEVAAGVGETAFGTDAVAIKEAIERADSPAGVVVLMDLGSAVLSAELALDLLADPDVRERVTLSPAPIVEGLVVAAVAAAGGASRSEVAAEARGALLGKAAHLSAETDGGEAERRAVAREEIVGVFSVDVPHGLHARPAARVVSEVRGLDASVQLRNLTTGTEPVPGESLNRVVMLAALQGHEIEVRAVGPQAAEAVEHLLTLAKRGFDEPAHSAATSALPAVGSAPGPLPASPGIAIGPARAPTAVPVPTKQLAVGAPTVEWRRVVEAVAVVRRDIEYVRVQTAREVGAEEASIFDAHLSLLADADLLADVKARIGRGCGALEAWASCLAEVESRWAALPDVYLRGRAADIHAVSEQVLRALSGVPAAWTAAAGVLVARDLTAAEMAGLDADRIIGVVLAQGSPTSHTAILARARGIPMIVAAGRGVLSLAEGTTIIIDGGSGELSVDPSPELLAEFAQRAARLAEQRTQQLAAAQQPAISRDGTACQVAANVGSVADARAALAAGADAAGLVRTEFLFLGRSKAPDVAEQHAEYTKIARAMAGRRIALRTLDVGGDKPLPYLLTPVEENPFPGIRGIRLSLDHRDLLREQLTAVCQTARSTPVSVIFPMVATLGELLEARQVLYDAAGPPGLPDGLRVGMMVEVPAAALKIESFLLHLDFVSIGTNDLTQYTLAADRRNGGVAALSDALDPAVLQLIDHVSRAAQDRVDVAVCGESASDELAIPLLVGLGVRELSVSPHAVPGVKAAIRQLDVARCTALARQALTLAGADDVRKLVLATLSDGGDS